MGSQQSVSERVFQRSVKPLVFAFALAAFGGIAFSAEEAKAGEFHISFGTNGLQYVDHEHARGVQRWRAGDDVDLHGDPTSTPILVARGAHHEHARDPRGLQAQHVPRKGPKPPDGRPRVEALRHDDHAHRLGGGVHRPGLACAATKINFATAGASPQKRACARAIGYTGRAWPLTTPRPRRARPSPRTRPRSRLRRRPGDGCCAGSRP